MSKWFHMLLIGTLLLGLVACSPEQEQATPMAAPYEYEFDYVWLTRDEMIVQAETIFVGRVMSLSSARWNQDSDEYWKGVGANLPYHEITVSVEQPLVEAIGLGKQATITVLGGSPAGSIQSGGIVIADKPEHTLRVGDQAMFFLRSTDLAWRPGPDMEAASRPVTMFLGAPSVSYLTLAEDGLYHSEDPQEASLTLDELIAKIEAIKGYALEKQIGAPTPTTQLAPEQTPTLPQLTPTSRPTREPTPITQHTPTPDLTAVTRHAIGLIPTNRFPELEVLHVPASVAVNQSFTVTVITHDSSSCTTPAGAKVEVKGLTAIIIPIDRKPLRYLPCTADLATHPREVELVFGEPGEATIWVIGQNFDEEPTNEYVITVNP